MMAKNETIDRLLVSPFLRCIQTANPFSHIFNIDMCIEEALWEANVPDITLPPTSQRNYPSIRTEFESTFRPEVTERFPLDFLYRCEMIKKQIVENRFMTRI
jgi:broad specificity phosphatase PhoE